MLSSGGNGGVNLTRQDVEIMRCLYEDARMPVLAIATKLLIPESTVRNRLNRLISNGVIEFITANDPAKLGYQVWVVFGIEVDQQVLDATARRLAELPELYFVAATTGGNDVMAAAVFKTNADFFTFLTEKLAQTEGVRRTVSYQYLKIYKRRASFLPIDVPSTEGAAPQG